MRRRRVGTRSGGPVGWGDCSHADRRRHLTEVVPTAPEVATEQTAAGGTATRQGERSTSTSSSSGEDPAATPPPSTGRGRTLDRPSWSSTRWAAPACTGAACRPRSSWRRPRSTARWPAPAEFGITAGPDQSDPTVEFVGQPGPQAAGRGPAVQRAVRPAEGRGVDRLQRQRDPAAPTTGCGSPGNDGSTTEITGTDVVLAAGSVPRTIPGFDIDGTLVHDLGRGAGPRRSCPPRWRSSAAGPSAASSPRCSPTWAHGDGLRGAAHHPQRLRRGRGRDGGPLVQEAGHRRQGRGARSRATRPTRRASGTVVSFGDGEKLAVDAVVVSVGRRPRTEGLVAPRHRGDGRRARLRGGRRAPCGPSADGVWAVGDVVAGTPQLAHVGFAEAIVVIKSILGRAGRRRSTTPGCPGPSTAIPRWPSPG